MKGGTYHKDKETGALTLVVEPTKEPERTSAPEAKSSSEPAPAPAKPSRSKPAAEE